MKKLLAIISFGCFVTSCGNENNESKESATADSATVSTPAENPDYTKGLSLVAKSDCLTCHKVSEKLIGPAYQAVADKYTATDEVIDSLAQTIIMGSVGKWGSVPMTAHPQLSADDAKAMVKYIMSLKN